MSRRKHDGADPASGGAMKGAQRSKGKITDDAVDDPRPSRDGPAARRDILAASLRARKLRYAIISNPKHVFYLTGFPSNLNPALTIMKGPRSTSFLAVGSEGECSLLVGKTEVQNPWEEGGEEGEPKIRGYEGDIVTYPDYELDVRMITYADELAKAMKRWLEALATPRHEGSSGGGGRVVAVEDWHMPDRYRSVVGRIFGGEPLGISEEIMDMRKTKGKDEIENLMQATKMLDFAYGFARDNTKVGTSELELYALLNHETIREFGPFSWIVGDLVSGERTLSVGGQATERRFGLGETVVLDLQIAANNYWSDMCRTFVVGGRPSQKQREAHQALLEIRTMAEGMLRPGAVGGEVHAAINDALQKRGHSRMIHHSGHGLGLDDQEGPWIIPNSTDELEEGQVCVLEPGIYAKVTGGMRLEDVYVITRKGCVDISHFPTGLGS